MSEGSFFDDEPQISVSSTRTRDTQVKKYSQPKIQYGKEDIS